MSRATSVNLKRRVKLENGWTFLPVAKRNGVYVADKVIIGGVATKMSGGTFYIEWREGGKRIQRPVGENGHEAIDAHRIQSKIHSVRADGVEVENDAPQIKVEGELLETAIKGYLADEGARLRPKSFAKYKECLEAFDKFIPKKLLVDVNRDDLRAFMKKLSDKLGRKTVRVKARIVHGVLRQLGVKIEMKAGDWPKATKKSSRRTYPIDTLKHLLSTVSREHFILWSFFLHTGFREQEVAFCSWADVNFRRNEISVTKKTMAEHGFDFTPKTHEERTVVVVPELFELLREHRVTLPKGSSLVFPTKPAKGIAGLKKPGGKNRTNMLDLLKLDYFRAGLNCSDCIVKTKDKITNCANVPQCRKVGLHICRHTFATNHLRAGVNIVDISRQLGHKDVATTHIYLHELINDDLHEKIAETGLGTMYLPDKFEPVVHKRVHVISDEARRKMSEGGKRSAESKRASS